MTKPATTGYGGANLREVEDFSFYLAGADEFKGHGGKHGFVLEVKAHGLHSTKHQALLSPDGAEFVHHGLFVVTEFPPVISLIAST